MNHICKKIFHFTILFLVISNYQFAFSGQIKYWVFFKDKGQGQVVDITEKALSRRKLRGTIKTLCEFDTYPNKNYIDSLKNAGLTLHHQSRWLNAVSVSGESVRLAHVRDFGFVKDIQPVATFIGDRIEKGDHQQPLIFPLPTVLDYGPSYNQLHICQIDSLHNIGYSGKDIYIGMMDTGYHLGHPVFRRIIDSGRLIATHDFINGDDNVSDQKDIQQRHGTATFSVIGGFDEGNLISAGYDAKFILAKTEIDNNDDIQSEEDNWVAAAEWMESLGVDIISSSLGYLGWYDTSQLDGNTAAITIAADIAAYFGVAVVNAAGNERNTHWGRIIPPADGDSVIAVGGVTSTGQLWSGSSPGPTSDGRIKPDIMAQASGVWGADYSTGGYQVFSGTSLATPVVAGGLAMVLEAHPNWSLDKLYSGLRLTASNADAPNNDMGWGIARMFDLFAVDGYFTVVEPSIVNQGDTAEIAIVLFDSLSSPGGSHDIEATLVAGTAEIIGGLVPAGPDTLTQAIYFPFPGKQRLKFYDHVSHLSRVIEILVYGATGIEFVTVPSPAKDSVVFLFNLPHQTEAEISIFTVSGEKIKVLRIPVEFTIEGQNKKSWDAINNSGEKIASGVYIGYLKTAFDCCTTKFAFVK